MIRSEKAFAYLCVATACVGWALSPIFIRVLRGVYDPFTLSLVRYTSALLPLLAINLRWYRRDFMALLRRPGALCILAFLNIVAQVTWTCGTYGTTATTALLISKVDTVFVILFAYFLFREERSFISHPAFLAGALMSFVGVTAVFASDPASRVPKLDPASILIVTTALFWAMYSIGSRHLVKSIQPIPLFTVVALFTALGFVPISLVFGDTSVIFTLDAKTWCVTFFAGILPLTISYPCFNYAQKHLGASFCSSITLFTPVMAYVLSFIFLPNEFLLPVQIIGAMILIAGTLIITVAHYRVTAGTASGDAPTRPTISEAEAS